MKRTHFILLLISTFLVSCNSNPSQELKTFDVNFISSTLTIDNLVAKENTDYIATIDFKEDNYNYRFPRNVTIYLGKKRLDETKYTFNNETGVLFIGGNIINDDLRIFAERRVIEGYQVNFEIDEHIHFYFYPTRDYSVTPIEDTIAIARDLNGKATMDGTGEINFKYVVDKDYDTDLFWMRGVSSEMEEIGESGIYRVANIKSDIRFCVNTRKIYCKNLCASADYSSHSFSFKWEIKNPSNISNVQVTIKHNGITETAVADKTGYTFSGDNTVDENLYHFSFVPKLSDGTFGSSIDKDMMLSPSSQGLAFPRVEISTENDLLPPYNVVEDPSKKLNISTVNNNYIQNIIKVFDSANTLRYDSSEKYHDDAFEGSKIKVRGNTSTVNSNGKESYKIKLKDKADLLDPFLNRSGETGGLAYQDREWLLLNCGNQLNELGGFSIEKSLGASWIPQCQYVTLFLNNDFKGIYVLCEGINRGNVSDGVQARCPIDEDGYIIENDPYGWKENLTFQTRIHQDAVAMEYTFKYPDADDLSYEDPKYLYINNYVKEFENYFYQDQIDPRYKNYIDVESFARWTLAHDLMHVEDYFGSNMFIYKQDSKNSKLMAGTTWDFDSAFIGNFDEAHAKGLCYHRSSLFYYIVIFKYINEFKTYTQDIFNATKDNIINDFEDYISYISGKEDVYNALLGKETLRFGKPQVEFDPQKEQIEHYLSVQIQYIKDHPYVDD